MAGTIAECGKVQLICKLTMCHDSKRHVDTGSSLRKEKLALRGIVFNGEDVHISRAKEMGEGMCWV